MKNVKVIMQVIRRDKLVKFVLLTIHQDVLLVCPLVLSRVYYLQSRQQSGKY